MSEYLQNQNQLPDQGVDSNHDGQAQVPQVPQEFIDSEVARSMRPFENYRTLGGVEPEVRRTLGERALRVADIIRSSPAQVAADIGKPQQRRTEHDPELAHLKALAVKGNIEKLARYERRIAKGKKLWPWQFTDMGRHVLGARIGEDLAEELYMDDPTVGPNMLEMHKRIRVRAGDTAYKLIKNAKNL